MTTEATLAQHTRLHRELEQRALALFDEAFELTESEREQFIENEAGSDLALLRETRALFAAASRALGVLDMQPNAVPDHTMHEALSAALAHAYDVGREIGRGGMASVFLARERKHDRDVVIKVLDSSTSHYFGAERFLREVRIAATLAHPNIVPLIDSGEADAFLYYVMPHMDGETLRARLRRDRMGKSEALHILRDIAGALAFAHEAGVVHRDIKPENVFLTPGHAYLLDFGIAKMIHQSNTGHITVPGLALGTRRYMAPEQALAADGVDARADIYAWGLLAIEMFAGESYLPDEVADLAPAALHRVALPPGLQALLLECVAPAAEQRPEKMTDVLARLSALSPSKVLVARSRRFTYTLAAAAAIIAMAAGTYSWRARSATAETLPEPVAVTILSNETGDSTLSVIGRFAGDWVTDGLQRMGNVKTISWSEARLASEHAVATKTPLVAAMHNEAQAATVVTGTYYKRSDSLYLQAQLVNAQSGYSVVLPQIVFAVNQPEAGISQLRDRVMGAIATTRDDRVAPLPGITQSPPSFSAYRAFDQGLDRFLAQKYDESLISFRDAFAKDTTFVAALILGARAAFNTEEFAVADTLVMQARAPQRDLGVYQDASLRYIEALLQGDGAKARAAILRAAVIAPNSRAGYDHAASLLNAGYAREAREQLLRMDPDRGEMRGWSSYWTQRAHAEHMLGNFKVEAIVVREMERRYPDRRVAQVLEARALAGMGDIAQLDSAIKAWESLPADVYWSQGAAMVAASEEFFHKGNGEEGRRYAERAVPWFSNRLVAAPSDRGHRYWLGCALYNLSRVKEARVYFESLAREFPNRMRYRGLAALTAARLGDTTAATKWLGKPEPRDSGEYLMYRARLAAIAGDTERAIVLLTAAADHGVEGYPWIPEAAFVDLQPISRDARGKALLRGR